MKVSHLTEALKAEFKAEELPFIADQCRTLARMFASGRFITVARPAIKKSAEAVAALRKRLNPFFHPTVINLVSVLWERDELAKLSDVAQELDPEKDGSRELQRIRVITASALSPEEQRRLEDALHKALPTHFSIEWKIDPALVGGVIIKGAGIAIDNSIATRIARLQKSLSH